MKFSEFNDYVRTEAQGCPDFLVERSVRDAAIDFCKRTDCFLEPDSISISSNCNEYEISVPEGTELNRVIEVMDGSRSLAPVSFSQMFKSLSKKSERGTPRYYALRDNQELWFSPIPAKSCLLRVLLSLKPDSQSTSILKSIGEEFREVIVHGALARLQVMSGQPFQNLQAAGINSDFYEREVGRTIRRIKYGYAGGSLTAKPRAFI